VPANIINNFYAVTCFNNRFVFYSNAF